MVSTMGLRLLVKGHMTTRALFRQNNKQFSNSFSQNGYFVPDLKNLPFIGKSCLSSDRLASLVGLWYDLRPPACISSSEILRILYIF